MPFNSETARKAGKIGRNNAKKVNFNEMKLSSILERMYGGVDIRGREHLDVITTNLLNNALNGDIKSIEVYIDLYFRQSEKLFKKKIYSLMQRCFKKLIKAMEKQQEKELK